MNRPEPLARTGVRFHHLFGVALLAAAVAGCQDYRWQFPGQPEEFERVEQAARQQSKYLFVFYRDLFDEDSGRMHGEVLSDNQVGALFQDTINMFLDRAGGPAMATYMSKYGVTEPPACVIVAPDGSYQKRTGFIDKERFIRFAEQAKSSAPDQRPGPKQPATSP